MAVAHEPVNDAHHGFEHLGRWADRCWDALRINLPNWPVMAFNIFLWGLVPRDRFFPNETAAGYEILSEHWKDIRQELDALLEERERIPAFHQVDPGQRRLSDDDLWKTYVFRLCTFDAEENRARCPKTAALLDQVPDLYSAFFSIFGPRKRLPLHSGAMKGVLRVQVALIVPEGETWIEVGGERRGWTEGGMLVFDDTFMHRAVNNTDEDRAVLFIDMVRPMPWPWLDRLNRWVLARITDSHRVATMVERVKRFDPGPRSESDLQAAAASVG